MLRRLLAMIATPIALTVLLAQPSRGATDELEPHGGHASALHLDPHPLKNIAQLHYGKDDHGGKLEPGEHAMPPPFAAVVFNFLAYAWLLGRVIGPSIKRMTRERHDEIARALVESARLRDAARARLAEYEGKLAGLSQEIDGLVAGIRAEAEGEAKRILSEADARAQRMQRDAEQQIQAEMRRVRATLEREAVEAAVGVAERLLREKTTEADQRALADRFLKGLHDSAKKRIQP
jgi:F0F1-type ATP synthase membrane subunit b/b'